MTSLCFYLLCFLLFGNESARASSAGSEPQDSAMCCPHISVAQNSSKRMPVVTGGREYTLWQVFSVTLPSSDCNTNLTTSWTRYPHPLSKGKHSSLLNITSLAKDTELFANVSLTIFKLNYLLDWGNYTVSLSSKECSGDSVETSFLMQIHPECNGHTPSPTQSSVVLSFPGWIACPNIETYFIGGSKTFFGAKWKGPKGVLNCDSNTRHYHCDWYLPRQYYGTCNYTVCLKIENCTAEDSGSYTVQALDYNFISSPVNFDINILPKPDVTQQPDSNLIRYYIFDYSKDFVTILFTKDYEMFKNNSAPGFFTITELDIPSTVQVVLHVKQSGNYSLCYEFKNFTDSAYNGRSSRKCTNELHVTMQSSQSSTLYIIYIVLALVILVLISALVGCVIYIMCMCKKRKTCFIQPRNVYGTFGVEQDLSMQAEETGVQTGVGATQRSGSKNDKLTPYIAWKTMSPSQVLKKDFLVHVARVLTYWKELARHLGLDEADIVTIEHNFVNDHSEQKMQMLLKWYQQQSKPPTCQILVRIIEEKLQEHKLAEKVRSTLHTLYSDERRPRCNTIV